VKRDGEGELQAREEEGIEVHGLTSRRFGAERTARYNSSKTRLSSRHREQHAACAGSLAEAYQSINGYG
jgi:hypothetical protein